MISESCQPQYSYEKKIFVRSKSLYSHYIITFSPPYFFVAKEKRELYQKLLIFGCTNNTIILLYSTKIVTYY
jgi:hypothetical protein